MNRTFYPKLAINNIRKNYQTQIPFIITCVSVIMMYYIICSLSLNESLYDLERGVRTTVRLLGFGSWVIGIFAVIFLLYTNGFLIKRRKKEFGLYSILGMEKKHIARVLLYETLFTFAISLVLGLILGVVFDKLMFMLLLNLIDVSVPLGFYISLEAIINTVALFSGIFALLLIRSISQVYISQPIELLKGSSVGEKEPKTKWLLTIVGVGSLAAGYYISLTTENPVSAILMFFVAVLLVVVGTYLLFTTGSIALLKFLRTKKNYYYKSSNFVSVSSMLYRMKQNAMGLASICILSTMVLVMLSTTTSLLVGLEESVNQQSPEDANIEFFASDTDLKPFELMKQEVDEQLASRNIEIKDVVEYDYLAVFGLLDKNELIVSRELLNEVTSYDGIYLITLITAEDYNKFSGENVKLAKNEVLIGDEKNKHESGTIKLLGTEYSIVAKAKDFHKNGNEASSIFSGIYMIVSDMDVIFDSFHKQAEQAEYYNSITHYFGFNLVDKTQSSLVLEAFRDCSFHLEEVGYNFSGYGYSTKQDLRAGLYDLYGGLFFLGVFLGIIFIIGTTLIIYYKQITEGYEDKERFEILQKVGMSHDEIRKGISSQVLQVFFMPLVVAIIHLLVAYKIIASFMALIGYSQTSVFIWSTISTISLFVVFYITVYVITARVYYRIIKR